MRKKIILLCITVYCSMMFAACGSSNSSIYNGVGQDILANEEISQKLGEQSIISAETYLNWCIKMKWYAIPIIIFSMLIGLFLVGVFRKVKKIQRAGVFVFIIGIPVTVFVGVYLACGLYGKLF